MKKTSLKLYYIELTPDCGEPDPSGKTWNPYVLCCVTTTAGKVAATRMPERMRTFSEELDAYMVLGAILATRQYSNAQIKTKKVRI